MGGEIPSADFQPVLGGSSHPITPFPTGRCSQSGSPQLAGSHAPSPCLVRASFCAEQMGTSCLGSSSLPSPSPMERCITGAGSSPLPAVHSSLFRGAGKSLTRLSFSAGGRAAFHSHDKLLLSKLHECSY